MLAHDTGEGWGAVRAWCAARRALLNHHHDVQQLHDGRHWEKGVPAAADVA
eukprot:gene22248-25918_t